MLFRTQRNVFYSGLATSLLTLQQPNHKQTPRRVPREGPMDVCPSVLAAHFLVLRGSLQCRLPTSSFCATDLRTEHGQVCEVQSPWWAQSAWWVQSTRWAWSGWWVQGMWCETQTDKHPQLTIYVFAILSTQRSGVYHHPTFYGCFKCCSAHLQPRPPRLQAWGRSPWTRQHTAVFPGSRAALVLETSAKVFPPGQPGSLSPTAAAYLAPMLRSSGETARRSHGLRQEPVLAQAVHEPLLAGLGGMGRVHTSRQ